MMLFLHMLQYRNLALYSILATDFGFRNDLYSVNLRRRTVDTFVNDTSDAVPKGFIG
jgi:hypothetical protein